MRLVVDDGLWSTGPLAAPTPLVAVLEVSGALLSWTVDGEPDAASITFTDVGRADWLWRVLGESGHSAVAAAVDGRAPLDAQTVDVKGVAVLPGSLEQLRRLALGHWMRRWWPESHRDGIVGLNTALLDTEVALLTATVDEFLGDETLDSDVADLLVPHAAQLNALLREGDPRVIELIRAASELTDDVGLALAEPVGAAARRDDYALAAGADRGQRTTGTIAEGTDSVAWAGVPPGVFDAAEDTIDWAVDATGPRVEAAVAVTLSGAGSPRGIPVRLRSRELTGTGVLDDRGRTRFPLTNDAQESVTETAAWNHDWQETTVTVGADVEESPHTRQRVRDFARSRLATPPADAFLAEILAAESDY